MISLLLYFLGEAAPGRSRQFLWLMAFIVLCGVVELAALSMLALFITSLSAPEQVMNSRYVSLTLKFLGQEPFSDVRTFYYSLSVVAITALVVKNVLTAIQSYAAARFDGALNMDFGVRLLSGFLSLPYVKSSGRNSAEVIQVISWKASVGTLASCLCIIATDATISILMFGTMLVVQPGVTLLVVAGLGITGFVSFRLLRGRALEVGKAVVEIQLKVSNLIMRTVQGLRDVTLFNVARESSSFIRRHQKDLARELAVQRLYERAPTWLLETVGVGGLVFGAVFMLSDPGFSQTQMMGTLSLVAVAAWRILPAMYRSMAAFGIIRSNLPCLERVREFVEETKEYELRKVGARRSLPPLAKSITLRDVWFGYEESEQEALRDINLTIPRGSIVGVIGPSGAGKSTLIDILSGLILPTRGSMSVDGIKVDEASREAWSRQIGLVPQSSYLFEGTLAQNVAYTIDVDAIDMERVRVCCRKAGVAEFLSSLPQGTETVIGERASQLSGGQAQRVAIARALYRNPQVLLFDEATSSLDEVNTRLVLDTIRSLGGDRTVVIVSHNMQSVMLCDSVFVLKDGRIADQGQPHEVVLRYSETA